MTCCPVRKVTQTFVMLTFPSLCFVLVVFFLLSLLVHCVTQCFSLSVVQTVYIYLIYLCTPINRHIYIHLKIFLLFCQLSLYSIVNIRDTWALWQEVVISDLLMQIRCRMVSKEERDCGGCGVRESSQPSGSSLSHCWPVCCSGSGRKLQVPLM